LSTFIHSRGNRPVWRALASSGREITASFVHMAHLSDFFPDDDWPKSARRARSAHLTRPNETLDSEIVALVLCAACVMISSP
jgi:hypothetical protein